MRAVVAVKHERCGSPVHKAQHFGADEAGDVPALERIGQRLAVHALCVRHSRVSLRVQRNRDVIEVAHGNDEVSRLPVCTQQRCVPRGINACFRH